MSGPDALHRNPRPPSLPPAAMPAHSVCPCPSCPHHLGHLPHCSQRRFLEADARRAEAARTGQAGSRLPSSRGAEDACQHRTGRPMNQPLAAKCIPTASSNPAGSSAWVQSAQGARKGRMKRRKREETIPSAVPPLFEKGFRGKKCCGHWLHGPRRGWTHSLLFLEGQVQIAPRRLSLPRPAARARAPARQSPRARTPTITPCPSGGRSRGGGFILHSCFRKKRSKGLEERPFSSVRPAPHYETCDQRLPFTAQMKDKAPFRAA